MATKISPQAIWNFRHYHSFDDDCRRAALNFGESPLARIQGSQRQGRGAVQTAGALGQLGQFEKDAFTNNAGSEEVGSPLTDY